MLKNVVLVEGKAVDVEKFKHFHPGGSSFEPYLNKNITEILKHYKHAKSTYHIIDSLVQDGDFDGYVDWSKPLYDQVGRLGKNYRTWVETPVLRPMRLFSSEWLEMQSKTNIHEVIIFWVPLSIWLMTLAWDSRVSNGFSVLENVIQGALLVSLGALKWTLLEYVLHRFVFHSSPPQSSSLMIKTHFLMHGLHHKVPFDDERLLFPIVPACGIATALYLFYTLYMPKWMSMVVMSGSILGYVVYDTIHHHLHNGAPSPGTYLHFMKRYHNQHHFSDSANGFGISSNMWDKIFLSSLQMRKLKFDPRWN